MIAEPTLTPVSQDGRTVPPRKASHERHHVRSLVVPSVGLAKRGSSARASTRGDSLQRARDAVSLRDLDGALEALIEAYGQMPAPAIADAITSVSSKLPLGAPIRSRTGRARFLAIEEVARAADVPCQLAGRSYLRDGLPILARRRPPDPRIVAAIIADLVSLPHRRASATSYYDELFAALARTRDPAIAPVVRDLRSHFGVLGIRSLREHLETLANRTAEALAAAPAPTLSAAETQLVAEVARLVLEGTSDIAALYAEVYANPHDPAPRLVLLDALATTRDPRGELLALQLSTTPLDRAGSARVKAIIKQHRRQLLGSLADWLMADGLELERGFVKRARVRPQIAIDPRPIGPEWTTIEELDFRENSFVVWLLTRPELGAMRRATRVRFDQLREHLSACPTPLGLASIWIENVRDGHGDDAALYALLRAPVFANLQTLEVTVTGDELPAWLVAAVTGAPVTCLRVHNPDLTTGALRGLNIPGVRVELVDPD